jgi:hypothetical protein
MPNKHGQSPRLLKWSDIELWRRDNPFILSGYRPSVVLQIESRSQLIDLPWVIKDTSQPLDRPRVRIHMSVTSLRSGL